MEQEGDLEADSEIDLPLEEFLKPLGMGAYCKKLKDIGCLHVRDMMSMTNFDLINLGMKNADDRKMLLSRLAVNMETGGN